LNKLNNIKIATKGLILNGEFKDWHIFIEDLNKGEGAYLILLTSPDDTKGYDDWVENFQSLEGYLHETKWKIIWLDEKQN